MKEYVEELLDVLSQEDADKLLDTLKVVEQEAKEETAKEIFADIDYCREHHYINDIDEWLEKLKKKYLGDV